MKRLIYQHIIEWTTSKIRKPLLIRGARQVGKTHVVRQIAATFSHFVEVNFELLPQAVAIFAKELDPNLLIRDLSILLDQEIIPGKTLLFLDEIQVSTQAILALRYFYEKLPELHVIAAGSLLDFAIEEIGMPVGSVEFLWMYPMTFLEFLWATDHYLLAKTILSQPIDQALAEPIHEKALALLGQYMAVGGMPAIVKLWLETQNIKQCLILQHEIINAYRQDFQKYGKKHQIKYMDLLFDRVPLQLPKPFKYTAISEQFKKRELAPCIDLLTKAKIITPIIQTAGNGIPLGAEANPEKFKLIFLDVALAQALLSQSISEWILNPLETFINKGSFVEAFIGQELLAYSSPRQANHLYYWERNSPNSTAEIDYLIQDQQHVIPVEVKSGKGHQLKSLHYFMSTKNSPYGIRFSTHNFSYYEKIKSLPLYAVAAFKYQETLP